MGILIRKAVSGDMADVHRLVMALAVYEKAPEQVITSAEDYSRDFDAGKFDVIVAEDGDTQQIVGMALYYFAYSTWKGQYLWLEDFIVEESMRGRGIGKMLFEAIQDIAKKTNTFLKWQVLDWNTPAIEFYDRYDAVYEREWITCRKWLR